MQNLNVLKHIFKRKFQVKTLFPDKKNTFKNLPDYVSYGRNINI